jgi:prenyltransferase beta subunit
MKRTLILALMAGLLLAGLAQVGWAAPGDASGQALQWLATQQNTDGGFSNGFSPESNIGATADAIIAIASAGQDASTWQKGGASPLDYLAAQVKAGNVKGAGLLAKVTLAAVATGQDPRSFGSTDLIAAIQADFKKDTNIYGSSLFDHALALLALANAGQSLPDAAVTALVNSQAEDGAWSFSGDKTPGAGDTNTTALAVQALVAANRRDPVAKALDYFKKVQNPDGGFTYQKPSQFGEDTDANSTALVIQALIAAGEKPEAWAVDGKDPLAALLALQRPSGAFSFNAKQADENVLATLQALPALNGVTFVQVRQVKAAKTPTAAPVTLPAAGGQAIANDRWLTLAGGGLALVGAGVALRRCAKAKA